MSNLKKVLSVGLASTMVMGMVATSAAAATYDKFSDKEDIVNKEAVSMVTELGIIAGLTDGSYAPKQNIDRASFARLVCVALNGGKEPNLGNLKTSFTDTQGNWAEKYIAFCVNEGIIAGKGNNTFAPSANVTGSEAAKMLLVALGYNTTYEKIGGANWQTATDVLANQAGLYDELGSMNTSDPLTRDNAAQMIYNTLNANKVKYELVPTVSANGQVTMTAQRVNVTKEVGGTTHNVTMLEDAFDAVKVEAVVVANEYADLSSSKENGSALDEGKTKLVVTNGDEQSAFKSGTYSVSTGADVLGKSITLYVKDDSSSTSKATVLGNAIISEDNKVVTKASKKEVDKLADDNDLDVVSTTQFVVNYGNAKDWKDVTTAEKEAAKARGVEKVVIDNDDDGDADFILVNTLTFGQVEKLSTKDDGSITVDTGAAKKLTADDKDDVVGFDDVKEDDYVLSAWIGGKLHVQKAEAVTGELESVKKDESLTVAGTKYDMSQVVGFTGGEDDIKAPSTYAEITSALDNEATFYLDANGMIVAMGNVAENASNYAYVWAYDADDTGIDSDRVKVTLSDGTTKTYTLADKSDLSKKITNDLTSENGSTKVQRIYAYSINKDGEIKLTNPKATSDGNVSASFSKNKTKVEGLTGAKTDYASSNTVFFYVSLDGKKIDDVEVYTGYKNAPGVDSAAAEAAFNSNDKMVAVAFEAADLSRTEKADHLFVTDVITSSSKTTTVKAILPGTSEEVEIKVDDSNWTEENVLCLFSKDSDGVYTLTKVTNEDDNDAVKHISSTTVATDSKEYKLTDKTVWIELDSKGGFDTASVGKLPKDSDKETVTSILANNDDEILVIITTEKAENKPAPEVKDNITVVLTDNADVKINYTGKKPTEDEVVAAVQAQLEKEGWTVKSIKNDSGKQYVFTATKGLLEKTFTVKDASAPVEVVTVTVNGAEKQVLKGTKLNDSKAGLKGKHVKETDKSSTAFKEINGTNEFVAGASYEDGFYKIGTDSNVEKSGATTGLASSQTVTATVDGKAETYVKAEGTFELTLKLSAAADGEVAVTVNGTGITAITDTTKALSFDSKNEAKVTVTVAKDISADLSELVVALVDKT